MQYLDWKQHFYDLFFSLLSLFDFLFFTLIILDLCHAIELFSSSIFILLFLSLIFLISLCSGHEEFLVVYTQYWCSSSNLLFYYNYKQTKLYNASKIIKSCFYFCLIILKKKFFHFYYKSRIFIWWFNFRYPITYSIT